MDGTWAPISSPGGVLPSSRAVHRTESDTNKRHKGNLFRQALKEGKGEGEDREAGSDESNGATAAPADARPALDDGEHRVDFLA